MAFLDEGQPRWDTYKQGGTGNTAVTSETERWLLVTATKAPTDKYATVKLTNATTDVIEGVTDGGDDFNSTDPYTLKDQKLIRIKTGKKIRVRSATAYVASNRNKGITPSAAANQQGWVTVASTGGYGRIIGGETIGSKNYLDVWVDESDK